MSVFYLSSCAFIKGDYIKLGYLRLIGYRLLSLLSLDDLILHNESFLPCIDLLYLLVCLLRNDSIKPPFVIFLSAPGQFFSM